MESALLMLEGFKDVVTLQNLLSVFVGSALGISIGALPGLNASMGIALLLPLTYGMSALPAIVMLLSIYCGAIYGGSITAILLRTPGTTATASFIGGIFSVIVLIFLSPPLARMALMFGPAEYFALCFFGLSIISSLAAENMVKGLISAVIGLLLGTAGLDIVTGVPRFTFDIVELLNGISFIPVLIGLFAVSQIFITVRRKSGARRRETGHFRPHHQPEGPGLRDGTVIRSSIIGTLVGILPGAGATMSSFISYNEARRGQRRRRSSAKDASKASPPLKLPTTPPPAAPWFPCSPWAFRVQRPQPS
jgi:putative tricarboxylic transport membrane protein